MTHVYYPELASVTARGQSPIEIASTTAGAPITVQTSAAHGYGTGDCVEIEGCSDPTADGVWTITVTGATTFTLDGSFSASSGSGGWVRNYTLLPHSTMIDDGDLLDAANLVPPHELTENKSAYLHRASGSMRVVRMLRGGVTDDSWAVWSSNAPGIFLTAAWATVSSGILFGDTASTYIRVRDGDVLHVTLTCTVDHGGGVGIGAIGLLYKRPSSPEAVMQGSAVLLPGPSGRLPISLSAQHVVSGLGPGVVEGWQISLGGYGNPGSPKTVDFIGHRHATLVQWRPN